MRHNLAIATATCFLVAYAADASAYIPKMWAQEGLMTLQESLILGNMVNRDFSGDVASAGDVVNTRRPGTFTSSRKGTNDDITIQDVNAENVPIALNQHIHSSFSVRDQDESLSFKQLAAEYIVPAMRSIAAQIDQTIAVQVAKSLRNSVGTLGGGLTKSTIIQARARLNKNKVPTTLTRNLILTSDQEANALEIAELTNAEKVNDGGLAMREASLGRRFGMNIYTSLNMPSINSAVATVNGTVDGAHAKGDTTIVVADFAAAIANGSFVVIGGKAYPVVATSGGSTPTGLTLGFGLLDSVADNAVVAVVPPALVNLSGGYARDWYKDVTYDSAAIEAGQLLTTAAGDYYGALAGRLSATNVALDVPLNATLADNAVLGRCPNGQYGMAFVKPAISVVSRPLAMPEAGTGVQSAIVNYDGWSIRYTRGYDMVKQRMLITFDMLFGIKVVDENMIVPVLG